MKQANRPRVKKKKTTTNSKIIETCPQLSKCVNMRKCSKKNGYKTKKTTTTTITTATATKIKSNERKGKESKGNETRPDFHCVNRTSVSKKKTILHTVRPYFCSIYTNLKFHKLKFYDF